MNAVTADRASNSHASDGLTTVDDLDVAIGRLVRQMNADSYRMLVLVREFDDRFGWKKWAFKSCAEWLAWRASISLSAAREKVRAAHALRSLPATTAAFADGRLSYSKVRALTRVAHTHDEDLLLAYALHATVSQLEDRCRQMRNIAPDSVHGARRVWARRSLTAWRDEARGVLRLTVEVPIEDGEIIVRALDCAVAAGEVAADVSPDAIAEGKGTTWRAQQADALVAVAKSYLHGGSAEDCSATADHYQVVLHADVTALCGNGGRADLPKDTIERLLCDCSVVSVLEDEGGDPLDIGRKRRTVSTQLRRALYARDRGCTFPGCHRTRYLDAHHLQHWIHGGNTSADNMTLLCTHHHRLLHEGGFSIVRGGAGTLRFVTADGRSIPPGGYRLEDFVDDACADDNAQGGEENPSREGFCRSELAPHRQLDEVRESRTLYRVTTRSASHRGGREGRRRSEL